MYKVENASLSVMGSIIMDTCWAADEEMTLFSSSVRSSAIEEGVIALETENILRIYQYFKSKNPSALLCFNVTLEANSRQNTRFIQRCVNVMDFSFDCFVLLSIKN